MSEQFKVEKLPEQDQWALKRGLCPWCYCRVYPMDHWDECSQCGDTFVGALTIDD